MADRKKIKKYLKSFGMSDSMMHKRQLHTLEHWLLAKIVSTPLETRKKIIADVWPERLENAKRCENSSDN